MTLAEDVRNELAAIAPARRCDTLAEISALFHTAGSLHLRGHGELAFHLDVSASSVARRASRCSVTSASRARSGRTGDAPSTARRATSCTSSAARARWRFSARPASSGAEAAR